ncbi:hypothetical protein PJ912_27220 [Pectobacterium colocasium]|uniref:Nucleoside 2-deoxyribosyltransferase n=1 Tax=Pectobacterium punjabense TaxID=2108399 RepID=A0ABX6KZ11_9GAMM|nr:MULTISPECIES: hypothetical protein [Pectobacterium]MBA0211934.1 hypothetical protein [Pectobacterium brasiliense]MBS4430974.1 hypothetical protein [Pectobacterium punjabense]PTA65542.1 hypothetical protein C9I36_03870 [Pectobacterium punjabense]QJA19294.1 hypothetical protein E2566_04800 [Pectobacterium punjabense]
MMFHLLVKYSGWNQHSDSVDLSRSIAPSYTDKSIAAIYRPNGDFSVKDIIRIPAIFMPEIDGSGEPFARVGQITNVIKKTRSAIINYVYDSNIPPIHLDNIEEIASSLGVVGFQLRHSHWAVHDADLFEVLFKSNQHSLPSPKVFSIDGLNKISRKQISVMMPFSNSFDAVYSSIKEMASEMGMACNRADDIWQEHSIIQDIVSLICMSSVVICDLSDKNPNVFYEAGIAHALGKEVILLARHIGDVPFDLRHLRIITYLNNGEGIANMIRQLRPRVTMLMGDTL